MKKKSILVISLLFLCTNVYALASLKSDFRDANKSMHTTLLIDVKSDKLPLNLFKQDWDTLPAHNEDNYGFENIYFDLYTNVNDYNIGVFRQTLAQLYINTGSMQTLYQIQKDFTALLNNSNIKSSIENTAIKADINYLTTHGLFLQKLIKLNKNNFLSTRLNLFYADELQDFKLSGHNDSDHFQASFDYYYSTKNYVSGNGKFKNRQYGLGYSFNLEYIYEKNDLYIYGGVFNLALSFDIKRKDIKDRYFLYPTIDLNSYLYWENVNLMHYDFDSEVIYLGDDGYNHYRPFGSGYYKHGTTYKQKIPTYYKFTLDYSLADYISIGDNVDIMNNMHYNELYVNFKSSKGGYKLGFIPESNTAILGINHENITFEIADKYYKSNNIMYMMCKISF